MNINNVVGAIGFVSRIVPSVYPISVIKADPNTGEPIRDSNGLCQVINYFRIDSRLMNINTDVNYNVSKLN